MLKTYEPELFQFDWGMRVEIDEDFVVPEMTKGESQEPYTTKDAIKDMVEFWAGWQKELKRNDGDYTKTFLQYLACAAFIDCVSNNHNTYGVISYFEDNEGWFKMDGTFGIKIIYTDDFNLSNSDIKVREITGA